MKIDKIYVICNRKDLYFARICIASIRYWNKDISIFIIKDLSNGKFDTSILERVMNVKVLNTRIKKLSYYAKLYPLIEQVADERIFIHDADIVWMCDMVELLERYDEDILIDGYNPADIKEEMKKWYYSEPGFSDKYADFKYPGFLFNVGQFVCNISIFKKEDFTALLNWEELPTAKEKNTFFYEQGMLNYLVAKKIKQKEISYRLVHFHRWGWDKEISTMNPNALAQKKSYPFLVHWYGKKNGLTSFLPGSSLLKFYEAWYFSFLSNGAAYLLFEKSKRSVCRIHSLVYETAKHAYLYFKNPVK